MKKGVLIFESFRLFFILLLGICSFAPFFMRKKIKPAIGRAVKCKKYGAKRGFFIFYKADSKR
jgi:hypothetical protein